VPPSTPAVVLGECHAAGQTGIFLLGQHAADRARERHIDIDDIRNALRGATQATLQDNGRWYVTGGVDLDGVSVDMAVSVQRGFVVITLF